MTRLDFLILLGERLTRSLQTAQDDDVPGLAEPMTLADAGRVSMEVDRVIGEVLGVDIYPGRNVPGQWATRLLDRS